MQNHIVREQIGSTRMITFMLGVMVVFMVLVVPMDIFGMDHMFTVHMIQHLLLSLVVPPLFLLSLSPRLLHQILDHHERVARGINILTIPLVASALFNGNIWIWHAPLLMQAMMNSAGLHMLASLLYLLTGLLFWWPLLDPLQEERPGLSLGGKLAYLFFSDMPMMLLGAGMTFSAPLYAFSMTNPSMQMVVAAQDQQVGGLLMWVVGSLFFIVVASIFFLRWMLQQENVQQTKEWERDAEMQNTVTSLPLSDRE